MSKNTDKTLVLYHASCNDGFCAAWLFWRYIDKGAEFVPVQYGEEPPDVAGRNVYVLDFSYKRPVMEKMIEDAASILILDHHKTARAELEGLPNCIFDMDKSGARLTWKYVYKWRQDNEGEDTPHNWLVNYTEDRDLWRWERPNSKAVSAALSSYERDFKVWEMIYSAGLERLIDEGDGILRDQRNTIRKAVANAREIELAGHKVPCVNSTTLVSEIGEELAKDAPFAVVWFATDNKIVYSLRSASDGIDVSEVAKQFGGGGHKHAAGFNMPFSVPIPEA